MTKLPFHKIYFSKSLFLLSCLHPKTSLFSFLLQADLSFYARFQRKFKANKVSKLCSSINYVFLVIGSLILSFFLVQFVLFLFLRLYVFLFLVLRFFILVIFEFDFASIRPIRFLGLLCVLLHILCDI